MSAEDACDQLRDSAAYACLSTTATHEQRWQKAWADAASTYPPGELIVQALLDRSGKPTELEVVEQDGAAGAAGEAMKLLRDGAPYPELVDKRRIFVRFRVRPAEVTLLVRPRGDAAAIHAALRAKHPDFLACYAAAAAWEKKPFSGTVIVTVGKEGRVAEARIESHSEIDEALHACLTEAARSVVLPPWRHDGQQGKLDLSFSTRERARR